MDLATLVVKLEAQSAQYVAELDKANKQLAKFHDDANTRLGAIGQQFGELKEGATKLVEAFAVKEVGEFFNKIIEGAAGMQGLSRETGIAVESVSALSAAAQVKGVDDLGLSMNRLARAARESINPTSDAAAAFDSIKVKATDASGKIKPLDQLFLEIADKFSKYQDGANKSAVATSLLGKAGYQLINFLDQGKVGIEEIISSMGGYASTSAKTAQQSEEFEENLTKLKLAYQGLTREGIAPILPDLIELTDDFLKVEKAAGELNLITGPLIAGARTLRAAFDGVGDSLKVIPATLDVMTQLEKSPTDAVNIFKNAWFNLKAGVHASAADISNDIHGISNELEEFKPDLPVKLGKGFKPVSTRTEKPEINLITGDQLRQQAEAVKQLTKVRESIDDQVASFGLGSVAVMKYSLEFGKLHDELVKAGPAGKAIEQAILADAAALERLKNADALTQLSAHMDELKNNTAAAAAALFDLQNRQLKHNLSDVGDKAGLDQLNHLRELTVAQAKYNDLQTQAAEIEDKLKLKEDAVQRALESGSENELTAQGQLKDAREGAVTDLDNIYQKMKTISDANSADLPKLVQNTDKFKSSLDDLQVKTNEVANKMRDDVSSSAADAWASWVDGEKSAKDAFKDFIKNIEREISQLIAKNMFDDLFKQFSSGASGGGGGGLFGSLAGLFMGGAGAGVDTAAASAASSAAADSIISETAPALLALAHGGTVKPQRMYLVGEHGPEIIVPTHHGVVIPNHRAHALVSGLAPRSFAHHGSLADHHSNMIQVRAPKHTYQAPAVHIGKQHGHQESIVSLAHPPRQEAMIHATHSPQFVHRAAVVHAATAYAHRALGGPVTQGRGTMVGEYGPELYAPTVNNAQLENNRMDKSLHVTNNFVLPQGGNVSRATQSQIASHVARSVQIASVRNQ